MQTIDLKLLQYLTSVRNQPCLSIYMPTHRVHPASEADPILFKNIFRDTLQYIQEHKLKKHEELLLSLEKLITDKSFWDHGSEGLAIFATDSELRIIRLPESVEQTVCVSDSFCVKPLFKIYHENEEYYLLALGLNDVALYRGSRHHIEELSIEDKIPANMKAALGDQLTDNHLHGSVVEGAGLHGYMEKSQEEEIDMDRFFRKVDQRLMEHFDIPKHMPLLLASLPEHHTHFARISKNPNLAPAQIQINPQALDKKGLLQKIGEVFDEILAKRKTEIIERYNLAVKEHLSSTDLGDVARDAIDGKIDVLCMENNRSLNGSVDIENRKVNTVEETQTDVFNQLACLVFEKGGRVVVLDKEDMPTETGVFTINRY